MTDKKAGLIIASAFFLFWLLVLLAGADHPPPPGFILVIIFDLGAAALVLWRTSFYINWIRTKKGWRILRVIADGAAAGVLFAVLAVLLSPDTANSQPQPDFIDHIIWITVLAFVGIFNSITIYLICHLPARRK